jgi:hypothetical protein
MLIPEAEAYPVSEYVLHPAYELVVWVLVDVVVDFVWVVFEVVTLLLLTVLL